MDAIQASFDCSDLENPMGERRKEALRLNFDRKLKLEFHGTTVTSDAGLIAYRELDEVFGLTTMSQSLLTIEQERILRWLSGNAATIHIQQTGWLR
jgi:hypothetical protein